MSFLRRAARGEDADNTEALEEQYKMMFPKIGRDFVHKDDLVDILQQLVRRLEVVSSFDLRGINFRSETKAVLRARAYKDELESGSSSNRWKDLIELDD